MNDITALVIDDDLNTRRLLSVYLEGFGFSALSASNGYEGIALAVEHHPVLIFLDIMMPEMTGHLTLNVLKHIKTTKDIPVVMITALTDTENLGMVVKMGAAGFVSKPFTRTVIFDKLRNIVDAEMLSAMTKKSSKA